MRALVADLEQSSLPAEQKATLIELIRKGGVRTALGVY